MSDNQEGFKTWNNAEEKSKAIAELGDCYDEHFAIERSSGSAYRTYIDIEPDRTIRPEMNRWDYNRFRPGEATPYQQKMIMKRCMDAARKGVVKNVIDLMGDFGSQGIRLVHPNKAVERFYQRWFKEVNGVDRSERFLNLFYRAGTVPIRSSNAKVKPSRKTRMKKVSGAADIKIEDTKVVKGEIPWKYDVLNPLAVDVTNNYNGTFIGEPNYVLNIANAFPGANGDSGTILPSEIRSLVDSGKTQIQLDNDKFSIFFYKKDDWEVWPFPMIYAILDDLSMLDKMKLADLSALDGAISQVRLWRLGSLEHKIVPNKAAIIKLRNILASHTGGGPIDLIWGPELDFKESDSKVHQFLGFDKYEYVLGAINGGLGVPSTLSGSGGSKGGFTNNYLSLNTLIKRLEYGRQALIKFWSKEIEKVQKAMGFKLPAQIKFDNIVLSDETSVKKLWIELWDRDLVADDTIREVFGEDPEIQSIRIRRQEQERKNQKRPPKASPYHNPDTHNDIIKSLVNQNMLSDEYYRENEIPKQDPPSDVSFPAMPPGGVQKKKPKKSGPAGGRPPGTKDSQKRKTKRVLPRTGKTSACLWAYGAQKDISEIITPMMLDFYEKKDVRSLNKSETESLEYFKLCALCAIEPFTEINNEVVKNAISNFSDLSLSFSENILIKVRNFVYTCSRKPNLDELKHIYAESYIEEMFDEDIQD